MILRLLLVPETAPQLLAARPSATAPPCRTLTSPVERLGEVLAAEAVDAVLLAVPEVGEEGLRTAGRALQSLSRNRPLLILAGGSPEHLALVGGPAKAFLAGIEPAALDTALWAVAHCRIQAAAATLTRALLHRTRNSLAGFSGVLAAALRELPPGATRARRLCELAEVEQGRIQAEARRCDRLTRQEGGPMLPLDLASFLPDVLRSFQVQAGACRRPPELRLAADLPRVQADRELLSLALLELLENAVAHAGQEMAVTAELVQGRPAVTVQDDGPGLEDYAPQAFQPFRGTRQDRQGLGLALAREAIWRQGGELLLVSETAGGTSMRILLQPWSG